MLLKLRKFFGGILMVISVVFGTVAVGVGYGEPIVITLFIYLLIGVLPFILALFLLKGRKAIQLNRSGLRSFLVSKGVRIYVYITIIIPTLLKSIDTLNSNNMERLSDPGDVYFTRLTVEWLGYTSVIVGLIAFISFTGVFVVLGWKNSYLYLRYMLVISLSLSIILAAMMHNDYKAINQDGLVISTLGNNEEISWSDVKHAYLKARVTSDGFSKTSGSSFKWEFEFHLKNGETEEFGPFSYSTYNLEDSINIKELLADKNISLTTDQLSDKEWSFVQIEMDYEEEAKPEDFYSIFQYDPKTREYYDIQY